MKSCVFLLFNGCGLSILFWKENELNWSFFLYNDLLKIKIKNDSKVYISLVYTMNYEKRMKIKIYRIQKVDLFLAIY